jgi:putative transposase
MYFEKDKIYHIYNRSNETVFYDRRNYLFFMEKVEKHLFPVCDILAWCLMPNHFHFLVAANEKSVENINELHRSNTMLLSKNIGIILSSYSQALNKQERRRGKLFSHNTNAICLNNAKNSENYAKYCFHYIHQNPYAAGLVSKLEDWEFSSFSDYANLRKGNLLNKNLAYEIINYDEQNFIQQSYLILNEKIIRKIL